MIKIFADCTDINKIIDLNKDDKIEGFTTNPTLMKASGIENYEEFAKKFLSYIDIKKPVSFEVIADNQNDIISQAIKISKWGENVYVKIPITTTSGIKNNNIMTYLTNVGVKVNATAITTIAQIADATIALKSDTPSIISIFSGRIADTGVNPSAHIEFAKGLAHKNQEILWASSREAYNYIEAFHAGADIITMTIPIYEKLTKMYGKSLEEVSLDTVKMFYKDALESGYKI